ncbi:MAG: tautomerase family protein [Promethearchaeota archaeon]
MKKIPIITVEGPPRGIEAKKELVRKLTIAFKEAYGYPEDFAHVTVLVKENPPENVSSNGKLLSEIWKKKKSTKKYVK